MDDVTGAILMWFNEKAVVMGEPTLDFVPAIRRPHTVFKSHRGQDVFFRCDCCRKVCCVLFDTPDGRIVCDECYLGCLADYPVEVIQKHIGPWIRFWCWEPEMGPMKDFVGVE